MTLGPAFSDHIQTTPKRRSRRLRSAITHVASVPAGSWQWRILPLVCAAGLLLAVLAGRLWQLQVVSGQQYLEASQQNSLAVKVIPAPRGLVYDSKGVVLARNSATTQLVVTYAQLPKEPSDRDKVIAKAALLTGADQAKFNLALEQAETSPFWPVAVASNLSREVEIALLAEGENLPGFSVEAGLVRTYPLGETVAHLLGYTGRISEEEMSHAKFADYHIGEDIGKSGIEQQYEADLHGQVGQKLSQVDAFGIPQTAETQTEAKAGHNLTLTIDAELQKEVATILQEAINAYKPTGAVGVIQDVKTGAVLSLVSLPSFDNNLFASGIKQSDYEKLATSPTRPLFNRSISGTYPPGSTIKPLVAAGAIDTGTITRSTIVNSPSFINVGTFRYADWTFWSGRAAPGNINVITAIAQSTDTFFYKIGGGFESQKGMGVAALKHYYTSGGLGSATGIDLPNEAKGVVPDPAWKAINIPSEPSWYVGNTYQLAIGQSYLLATPLQINNLTNAIANNGNLLQPYLLNKITDSAGQVIQQTSPSTIRQNIVKKEGLKVAQEGFRAAVATGIVYPLRTNNLEVAAKTGTAEFGTQNAVGEYQTHSWVTGYAPYSNPQISFTVLLESGGSSTNAAQVANKVIQWYEKNRGAGGGQ